MMKIFRAILTLMAAAAVATGCGRSDNGTSYQLDRERYPVAGIDISAHNGKVDFEAVKAAGYDFVIIKATEGATFKDKRFLDNYNRATEAGLKVGAYHFFRFDKSGYMQGLNFVNSVNGRELHLPVVIDIEEWTNQPEQPTSRILDRLNEMVDHLENHGYKVMLYTNKKGFQRFVRGHFPGVPVWLCSLADEPAPDARWTLWQVSHTGSVEGVEGAVDINAFNGTREEWEAWLNTMQ